MKKNRLKILVILLLLGMAFVGNINGITDLTDYIKIINITPNNNLIDGTEHQFTVTVEYFLATQEQAMIYIGFNTKQPNRYNFVSATPLRGGPIVYRGRGEYTFNVTAIAKNWYPNGRFGVYANLSPFPHNDSWNPLTYDIKRLSF
jgi:hypothetical protein